MPSRSWPPSWATKSWRTTGGISIATRVRVIYLGRPVPTWPMAGFDINTDIQKIGAILADMKDRLDVEVEFTGWDVVRVPEDVEKLRRGMGEIDGILAFNLTSGVGRLFRPIVELGIPTVLFSQPYSGHDWTALSGFLREGMRVDVLATSDYGEIAGRLELMDVIRRLKDTKIVCVRDEGVDPGYAARVKDKYGVEILSMGHERLLDAYASADGALAERLADEWIRGAVKVVEPSKEEIVKSSRMYLAVKRIMEEEKATAITIDCLGLFARGALPAYPCLAFSKLNDEGLTGVCEADLDSTLTQLILGYLSGKPGFVSDPVMDTATNTVIHAHCVAATRMDGPAGPALPYIIRSHAEDDKGASLQVLMRPGQKVTVAKLTGLERMLVSIAEIIDSPDLERGCRTKARTRVADARKMLENWSGGLHRVLFYGDYIQDITNLGRLLGFEVALEQ